MCRVSRNLGLHGLLRQSFTFLLPCLTSVTKWILTSLINTCNSPNRYLNVHTVPQRFSDIRTVPQRFSDIHTVPQRFSDIRTVPQRFVDICVDLEQFFKILAVSQQFVNVRTDIQRFIFFLDNHRSTAICEKHVSVCSNILRHVLDDCDCWTYVPFHCDFWTYVPMYSDFWTWVPARSISCVRNPTVCSQWCQLSYRSVHYKYLSLHKAGKEFWIYRPFFTL